MVVKIQIENQANAWEFGNSPNNHWTDFKFLLMYFPKVQKVVQGLQSSD
jgi:hypothetical protein